MVYGLESNKGGLSFGAGPLEVATGEVEQKWLTVRFSACISVSVSTEFFCVMILKLVSSSLSPALFFFFYFFKKIICSQQIPSHMFIHRCTNARPTGFQTEQDAGSFLPPAN